MDERYMLGLSLLDFLPNLAFLFGAICLIRWTRKYGKRFSYLTMIIGSILVLTGGTSKAIWKLIFTLGLGDITPLGEAQFILLAPGFLLMFLSSLSMVRKKASKSGLAAMALWKIPFLAVMTISNFGLLVTLGYTAYRKATRWAVFFFAISLVCMLSMAGMATAEQSIAQQWIEEGVNSLGQITFAIGSYLILKKYK